MREATPLVLILALAAFAGFACGEVKESGYIPSSMIPPRVIPGKATEAPAFPIKEYSPRPGVLCWTFYSGAIDCEFVPEWYQEQPKPLEKMP